ncbi:MAG: hypothetical protein LBV16_05715 [Elusimicrobiota bacterium]|nr:hypothetical protein [Elusimicrobiota bacterium]
MKKYIPLLLISIAISFTGCAATLFHTKDFGVIKEYKITDKKTSIHLSGQLVDENGKGLKNHRLLSNPHFGPTITTDDNGFFSCSDDFFYNFTTIDITFSDLQGGAFQRGEIVEILNPAKLIYKVENSTINTYAVFVKKVNKDGNNFDILETIEQKIKPLSRKIMLTKSKFQSEKNKKLYEANVAKEEKEEAERIAKEEREEAERVAKEKKEEAERIAAKNKAELEKLAQARKAEIEQIEKERKVNEVVKKMKSGVFTLNDVAKHSINDVITAFGIYTDWNWNYSADAIVSVKKGTYVCFLAIIVWDASIPSFLAAPETSYGYRHIPLVYVEGLDTDLFYHGRVVQIYGRLTGTVKLSNSSTFPRVESYVIIPTKY